MEMHLKLAGYIKVIAALLFFIVVFCNQASGNQKVLQMATTTSTQSSGLLEVLLPALKGDTGITLKVIAKGTGAAIRDGIDGNVDVIFVHARGREDDFVAQGYGTKRYGVMHNDFIIIGPASDPAGIKGMNSGADALKKISQEKTLFISRGDDSGTHTKEQHLWKESGIKLAEQNQTIFKKNQEKTITSQWPASSESWYISVGPGIGKTTIIADEKQGYTLIDRGTFIKYKYGRTPAIDLVLLCEGDSELSNPYGVIPVNPLKHPHVRHNLAVQFAEWLVSPRGQALIANYRLLDKQLFYPDALDSTK